MAPGGLNMITDYYRILKVPPEADLETIKKAYRARAMESHPDRGGSHQAMLEINEAFEVLRNPAMRRNHDEARRNEFNQSAQEQANADASQARQRAQEYPRNWNEFDAWLDAVAKDFQNAEYGTGELMFPTVGKSYSGWLFVVVGGIAGLYLAYQLSGKDFNRGRCWTPCVIGGATLGMLIHKFIGQSIKAGATPTGASSSPPHSSKNSSSPPRSSVAKCPQCGQQLRCPPDQPGVRLRCPRCQHEFTPHGESQAQVPQTAKRTAEDKGMGYASVAAVISGIFLFNSCSQTVSGGFFDSAITERNWPAIIAGTVICAVVAYNVGKKS